MRYALIFVVLSLLLEACFHCDTKVREQIIGTWLLGDSAGITFVADGSFQSKAKMIDRDVRYDGTWEIRDGVLITKTTHASFHLMPGTTNLYSPAGADRNGNKIILMDSTHFAIVPDMSLNPQGGAKTNVWERKR